MYILFFKFFHVHLLLDALWFMLFFKVFCHGVLHLTL